MSDDINQDVDELSLAIDETESNADASTTEGETKELNLSEESEDKKSVAQSEKTKQVAAWAVKVLSGAVDINSLPNNQKWMKGDIEKLLLKKQEPSEDMFDARLEQKLKEKETSARFEKKLAEVKSQKLSNYQKTLLEAEYKDLRASGVPKDKALEKALKLTQAEDKQEEAPVQRKRMELPHMGNFMGNDLAEEQDAFLKKPEKERMELYKSILKSSDSRRS